VLRPAARMDLVSMRMILPNCLMTISSPVSSTRLMPMTSPISRAVFKTEFPKRESLKNKSGKSGVFFDPEKPPSTHHVFTSNPPQIHHKKPRPNHPFLPKPPAKTGSHHLKKNRKIEALDVHPA
jgi:hypothetical protein